MKIKIQVNRNNGYAYIPERAREEGYEGEITSVANHFTWVWMKPGATLEQVKRSLEITIQDIKNQMSETKQVTEVGRETE